MKFKPASCCSVSRQPKRREKTTCLSMTKAERKSYSRLNLPVFDVWRGNGKRTQVIPIVVLIMLLSYISPLFAFETETSWYSNLETHGRKCADGKYHNLSSELVCASWEYSFGSILRVVNLANGKSVVVRVVDRGPAKRLCRVGRRLDLSRRAFEILAGGKLGCGLLQVEVTLCSAN